MTGVTGVAATPDMVRRVLASWISIEVLTPQVEKDGWSGFAQGKDGWQRNTGAQGGDGLWQTPGDHASTPWTTRDRAKPRLPAAEATPADQRRPWHCIVLGALPAQAAFERLDAAFGDAPGEAEINGRPEGHVIGASVVLDEFGVMVPDSLALASFAWGLGRVLCEGAAAPLADWDRHERALKLRFASILTPRDEEGAPRSLTWLDLRSASLELAEEFGLPEGLWTVTPCSVQVERDRAPAPEILSSFHLSDLCRVRDDVGTSGEAAAAYLGLRPPEGVWDALSEGEPERKRLSDLLDPGLFPLGRWPGPGLHPLSLLQQAAVNAVVRDLDGPGGKTGLRAINGPPGTGKTTLLRDLVAHVIVSRAERLAGLEDPAAGLDGLDLMAFAVVVASSNNVAVENVSLELPVRSKALDGSFKDLNYFAPTADAVLRVKPNDPADKHAWGLLAARLGNAKNRSEFFGAFWWDEDWGLRDWLDIAAWPDNQARPAGKLARLDPPPRRAQAMAEWRKARGDFRRALERCRRVRGELQALGAAGSRLRAVEAAIADGRRRLRDAERDRVSAARATAAAWADVHACRAQEAVEAAKVNGLASAAPSFLSRLFRTRAWRTHRAEMQALLAALGDAQAAARAAQDRHDAATAEDARLSVECEALLAQRDGLRAEAADLGARLREGGAQAGDALPGPGFWAQADDDLQRASPWNGGAFRAARDALFAAAVRLHRAFIAAAARPVKQALHNVAQGKPSAADWGIFFLVVPVVSTTFASIGRMFAGIGAAEIGWLLVDEAGQAAPQAAVGAIWRARRAVVIGDPLQIEPVVTTPEKTTGLIFGQNGVDPAGWAAPGQSAQTLADRASPVQGRLPAEDGGERITGLPLLVHRRCEEPMFGLANRIAYAGRMVFATGDGPSPIREVLGPSAWIDVDAPSADKWVEAEGTLIAEAIRRVCAALPGVPDLYVICPFKVPADRLRHMLARADGVLPGFSKQDKKDWIKTRVGTVHTFQGKEAEAVILMLGAGRGAKPGSRRWAGRTPNLLNVAATRAKRALYVVGNRAEWQGAGVFVHAARELDPRSAQDWLPGVGADPASLRLAAPEPARLL